MQAAAPRQSAAGRTNLQRIERASADVHRFVLQHVANRADAADISQEALLAACAKLSTFRGNDVHAWLYRIARNLIFDYYRSRGRFQFVTVEPATGGKTELALRVPPDAVLAQYELRHRLDAWVDGCANGLDLEQQVAVLQSDVYDYSDKESAAMLRMSVPSFKLLLHGARARLKEIGSAGRHAAALARPGGGMPSPPAHVRFRKGVINHIGPTELVALQRKLMDGLRLAAL